MKRLGILAVLVSSMAWVCAAQTAKSAAPAEIAIHAGKVLDVRTGNYLNDQTIWIEGDRIKAIGKTAEISGQLPAGAKTIDLSQSTVLPGLIDCHTHLTMTPYDSGLSGVRISYPRMALAGARNARVTLEAGFTTVRNLGASGYSDIALRDAINAGDVPGPRMLVSGPALSITGGHCDNNLLPFEYHAVSDGVADGIAAVQHKVRENIKYGSDLIKVCATGGVLSKGDDPQASQYTLEEMKAIVADAHRLGRKVAAHAHGAQGILWASEAGVDSIEHGSYIDDAGIAMMLKHGTYLVPTSYLYDWYKDNGHLPALYAQKMKDVTSVARANHKRAIAAGVKVALGTDSAVYPHGLNAHELEVYVREYNMTPLAAIQSGTVNAADLMGWTARTGSLDAGKWADIIAIQGDPL